MLSGDHDQIGAHCATQGIISRYGQDYSSIWETHSNTLTQWTSLTQTHARTHARTHTHTHTHTTHTHTHTHTHTYTTCSLHFRVIFNKYPCALCNYTLSLTFTPYCAISLSASFVSTTPPPPPPPPPPPALISLCLSHVTRHGLISALSTQTLVSGETSKQNLTRHPLHSCWALLLGDYWPSDGI